jgi:hypothetical protein
MRRFSPELRRRNDKSPAAERLMRTALVFSAVGLSLADGISSSAAQQTAEVGYVEAVRGRVVASSRQGGPTVLDVLDIVSDRTRLDLPANTELRICHYQMRRLVVLTGPLRASITAAGVTGENGKTVNVSAETCGLPVVSTFQGGLVSRNIASPTTKVPLRPSIKIVNSGSNGIRRITLWDGMQQTMLVTFDRHTARPILDDGRSYLLVVERNDGRELKMLLQASAETRTGPFIFVVP